MLQIDSTYDRMQAEHAILCRAGSFRPADVLAVWTRGLQGKLMHVPTDAAQVVALTFLRRSGSLTTRIPKRSAACTTSAGGCLRNTLLSSTECWQPSHPASALPNAAGAADVAEPPAALVLPGQPLHHSSGAVVARSSAAKVGTTMGRGGGCSCTEAIGDSLHAEDTLYTVRGSSPAPPHMPLLLHGRSHSVCEKSSNKEQTRSNAHQHTLHQCLGHLGRQGHACRGQRA